MRKQTGFTLIEVLIAVAILSIALIAIVRNTSLAANETAYLQERSIAHWVAMDTMAKARTGLITIPSAGGTINGEEVMLDQTWNWQIKTISTIQPGVIQIQVIVTNTVTHKQMDSVSSYMLAPGVPQ